MKTSGLHHPAVDAALATAATLIDMELVLVGSLSETSFIFERVYGEWSGLDEGTSTDRADSFCDRMLSGAPCHTADAASDGAYSGAGARTQFGITSYVGVPICAADGTLLGTLCGLDRGHVDVAESTIGVLHELAKIIAAHMSPDLQTAVIRRTPEGWQVGDDTSEDLLSAMVLADLLAGELPPTTRPAAANPADDELTRLKVTVGQLEHALAVRITIEQAIGVLAERQRVAPRSAFEQLRRVARSAGLRIHDLSREVVASTTGPAGLPPELQ